MDDNLLFPNLYIDNDDDNKPLLPEYFNNYNISYNDWNICINILGKIKEFNINLLKDSFYRDFRSLISDIFYNITNGSFYKGSKNKEDYIKQKEIKKNKQRKDHMMKQLDFKYQNTSKLRKKRLEALSKLEYDSNDTIPMIEAVKDNMSLHDNDYSINYTTNEYYYPKSCYSCKIRFFKRHHFYDRLCPSCASLNWEKRNQRCNLNGWVVILTGGRVKIGFKCGLKLLRDGCEVIITTRFPQNAAKRYLQEPDSDKWKHKLHFYGLDLRDITSVIQFTDFIKSKFTRLDVIINNAAQTVRRPSAFYKHLIPEEIQEPNNDIKPLLLENTYNTLLYSNNKDKDDNNHTLSNLNINSAIKSQIPLLEEDTIDNNSLFPKGVLDIDNQQLDLRENNSWIMKLHEISPIELIEVHCVNVLAPFILISNLKSLLDNTNNNKFIINVSAMEGKFYRKKTPYHPHTNMAKAGLNMITKTCGEDYAKSNIYMTSIDTGWIHDENPYNKVKQNMKQGFQTPIDEEDAASRILDPIYLYKIHNIKLYGKFYKDYKETSW